MKKKKPLPAAQQKAPAPPAKQAAPPDATPKPMEAESSEAEPATPAGKDVSAVPVEAAAPEKPDEMPSETPSPEPGADPKKQATVPKDPIDWFAMRQPFLNRGVPLTARDGAQIEQNWTFTYNNMLGLGLDSDLAVKIANFGTPIAYDFALQRDNPTRMEIFDAELEKTLPPGQSLRKIVVPVITPDSLNFIVKKTTGKDIDFRF